ncbi:response regulator [Engelhardtia mirabilis]|uniref:Response regulator ArlR n=1 Tax=Engelhardtia mirabilis TaxID=2528011 RepID=A0A518BRE7_9BACT|nr:Response regulator ArlR [Planctomycetes bacterium Pla133]QDV03875.1 Response regulator ArlR [Planctomycetes bacterium Pla86]
MIVKCAESDLDEQMLVREAQTAGVINYQRLQTVLLIEDQEDLNRALATRLQWSGLNVESAFDGLTGLNKIETLDPDLILLDLCLPELHGFKLLHAIRHHSGLQQAPIIVLTGDTSPGIARRAARAGVRRVFRKPVSFGDVVEEAHAALEGF